MKKYIKIIVSIVICMFMIFLIRNNVNAQNLENDGTYWYTICVNIEGGNTVENPEYPVLNLGKDYVLCIEQGKEVSTGATYRENYHIKIDGTIGTVENRNVGNNEDSYNKVENFQIDSKNNAIFSYILAKTDEESIFFPERKYSNLQKHVYNYCVEWFKMYQEKGIMTDITVKTDDRYKASDWDSEARDYANQLSSGSASITNNTNKNNLSKEPYTYNGKNYTKVGPFNFSFNAEKYSDKKVYDQNDKDVTEDVYYASYNGKTLNVYDQINYASKSGTDFYLLVPTSVTNISKFTVSVKKEVKKIITDIWVLQRTADNYQNIISTDSKIESKETTASSTITDINIPTTTYINLSGYVWEDKANKTKNQEVNGLYKDNENDTEDKLLKNVIVKLKESGGKVVQSTTTNANGQYIFKNVLISDLSKLYIEFTYNGFNYQSVTKNLNKTNSSKASDVGRGILNTALANIRKGAAYNPYGDYVCGLDYILSNHTSKINLKNDGEDLKYGYNGAKYPINGVDERYQIKATTVNAYSGYLDEIISPKEIISSGTKEIKNINLGLREREQPDLSVVTDLYSSKINISGESFTYLYENRLQAINKAEKYNIEPKIKFGQERGKETYTRALYASDIKYTGTDSLEVKLTYRIGIHNQSTTLKTTVHELVDYFDVKYDNESIKVGTQLDKNGEIINSLKYTLEESEQSYKAEYSKVRINTDLTLKPQSEAMVYIELTVKPNEIIKIIDQGQEVKLDNIAEIASYSTKDNAGNIYAGIDIDSQPENADPVNSSTYEDDTDVAPGVLLVLQEERTIEGSVFEDSTPNTTQVNQIRVGSGKYDIAEGDKGIAGIEVIVKEEGGNIAKVYDKQSKTWKEAKTITDASGNYNIKGFIPGKYYITFKWGGKEYILSDRTNKLITVQDYKGTIVDKQSYTQKLTNDKWYKDSTIRESDAIDNYETRKAIDNEIKEITYKEKIKIDNGNVTYKTMESTTPVFKIEIEYSESPIDATKEYEINSDGTIKIENGLVVKKEGYKNIIKNIDFGIVERARQDIKLTKRVKTMKVTLANGQVIEDISIDENGNLVEGANYATYAGPAEDKEPKNGYVKIELDNELIQGATLEVTYEIKGTNISELDYISENFYKYGIVEGEKVKIKIAGIIDYLDSKWAFEESEQWKVKTVEEIKDIVKDEVLQGAKNRTILYTESLSSQELEPNQSIAIDLNTSKLLANNEEINLNNEAEITKITKNGGAKITTTPGNYVPGTMTKEIDETMAEEVIITPNTGENLGFIIPSLVGIISALILLVGVIFIKKKALR